MRLTLLDPPVLVSVVDAGGGVHRALLIGTRGDCCFVQLNRGPGLNHLRWVPAAAVSTAAGSAAAPAAEQSTQAPDAGALPWIHPRDRR